MLRSCGLLLLSAAGVCAPAPPPLSSIADHLTANALKADVSFLASDALEGRGTPSRSLDIAAEYIAAQFRRAGLEPAGDDGYFQTASMAVGLGVANGAARSTEKSGNDAAAPPNAKVWNVVGVLRGSDAALEDTYLIVTAHYDHLGTLGPGQGDRIFNGANDDASGTASVIEIANALAALPQRPRRSIVFMAFFGEEEGELGSHYYVRHPLFPLAKTIADINLEQLGRTDDIEGPRVGLFNLTGFDFTDLAAIFRKAAEGSEIKVVKDEANSDAFFTESDNSSFADAGVPSTSISVGYIFPDYHEVSDEWPKLDYDNMAKVDRAIALGIQTIANSTSEPHWNAENPNVAKFVKANEALTSNGLRKKN